MRALREARSAENTARTKTPPPPTESALCGHRNMGGRSCTRELNHAEKSHRYS
jgi:hypothetical protein